jgi:hypothetical protein
MITSKRKLVVVKVPSSDPVDYISPELNMFAVSTTKWPNPTKETYGKPVKFDDKWK